MVGGNFRLPGNFGGTFLPVTVFIFSSLEIKLRFTGLKKSELIRFSAIYACPGIKNQS
jgi:hypothetical protein